MQAIKRASQVESFFLRDLGPTRMTEMCPYSETSVIVRGYGMAVSNRATIANLKILEVVSGEIKTFGLRLMEHRTETYLLQETLRLLINAMLTELQKLKAGFTKNTGMLAWACRDLLELNIFIQYVLHSKSNLQRFLSDRLIDGIQIFEYFKAWQQSFEPNTPTPEIDETLRLARIKKDEEGLTDNMPLRTGTLAEEIGVMSEYRLLNKVCSKLIHPTAWSVLAMNDEGEYAAFRPFLLHAGIRHGLQALEKMKEYVEKFGVDPKP
jgi:hypothetical protein